MSVENTVEEKVAAAPAVKEDENKSITSRKYKITVCIIAALLAVTFLVKDYVVFRDINDGATSVEVGIVSFIKWWFDKRKRDMIAGMIIILLPYEIIYNSIHKSLETADKDSAKSRKWTVIGLLVLMLIIPVWIVFSANTTYQMAIMLCNVVLGFILCLNLKQYFSTAIEWLVYATIYNICSFGSIYYSIYKKADMVMDADDPRSWIHMGYVDTYLIVLYLSSAIAFIIYALIIDEDDRNIFTILCEIVGAIGFPVAIYYKTMQLALAYADNEIHELIGFEGGPVTGIKAFKDSYLLAMYVCFLVIVVLMIYAMKKVAEYSRRRIMVLFWTAMFMFLILIIDMISEAGIGAGYSSLFYISDMVNFIVLFIVIRTLIIPVKSQPDMDCDFRSESERIRELEFSNEILNIHIDGLQDRQAILINYMKVVEVKYDKNRAWMAYMCKSDSEDEKQILESIENTDKVIEDIQQMGKPSDFSELVKKMKESQKSEINKIDEAYKSKFKEMGFDEDEDDEIEAEKSSEEDSSEQ